jgi:hypothetical protein
MEHQWHLRRDRDTGIVVTREGGGNVLRSVKTSTYTFSWKATHLNFHVAVKYHNVLNLGMVVI